MLFGFRTDIEMGLVSADSEEQARDALGFDAEIVDPEHLVLDQYRGMAYLTTETY